MCAYDTTIIESLDSQDSQEEKLPPCLQRNLLDNEYFPAIRNSTLTFVIALSVIFLVTSINRLNHTDLWGHLNFGRWIVENGSLPSADPFAAESLPAEFLNVPWLSQVLGYTTIQVFGTEGLILGHALLVTLACAAMIMAIRARGASLYWAVAGGVVLYVLSLPIVGTVRPQLFGMLGGSLVLLACSLLPKRRHPMFWLPVAFLFWANLHGSFVMGIAMLGLVCLGTTWNVWKESGNFTKTMADSRFQRMWLTLTLSVIATCINPNGPLLLVQVVAFGGNSALSHISEWRSLTPNSFSGILFFSSVAIGAVLLRYSDTKLEVSDILLLALFGLATISAIRMLAWWAMVWPWVMIPLADRIWSKTFSNSEQQDEETSPMSTVIAMGFVFMCLLISPPSQSLVSGRHRGIGPTTSTGTPIFVAERLEQQKIEGRIFSPLDWADYIVWRNNDRIKPLVYSHVHLVNPDTFQQYLRISSADPAWQKLARDNDLKYLVVDRKRHENLLREIFLIHLSANPHVRVIYQDQQAVIAELLPVVEEGAEERTEAPSQS